MTWWLHLFALPLAPLMCWLAHRGYKHGEMTGSWYAIVLIGVGSNALQSMTQVALGLV